MIKASAWGACKRVTRLFEQRLQLAKLKTLWSIDLLHTRASRLSTTPGETVPFRKQLKDEKKRKCIAQDSAKHQTKGEGGVDEGGPKDELLEDERTEKSKWKLTVGLEIHAQLNTDRKLFSSARASTDEEPNSNVAVYDLAFPGSQPKFQKATLIPAIRAALALECDVRLKSRFDRKHYFYQDQPAGYQVTQYYEPFAVNGAVNLSANDVDLYDQFRHHPNNFLLRIGIKQIQLEQDTAKSTMTPPSTALLDFNRVGHPLIEIITLPEIHTPEKAVACVKKIQSTLQVANAVTTGMEDGGLRADVNVSVSLRDSTTLGQRVEIKNLNSFQAVQDAIVAEKNRQVEILEGGGVVEGETRGWTLGSTETRKLRGKEGEVDYRYMPDPDILPLIIGTDLVNHIRATMPPAPDHTLRSLIFTSGITPKDAMTLYTLDKGDRLDYFDKVKEALILPRVDNRPRQNCEENVREETDSSTQALDTELEVFDVKDTMPSDRTISNWVLHELGHLLTTHYIPFDPYFIPASSMASIILNLENKRITRPMAKTILAKIANSDLCFINKIIRDEQEQVVTDLTHDQYRVMAQTQVDDNPDKVRAIVEKKQLGKLEWFTGQMIKRGKGIEPAKARAALRQVLGLGP